MAAERENQKNIEKFNRSRKIKLKKIDASSIGSKVIGSNIDKNKNNLEDDEINEIKNESNSKISNDNMIEERINLK